MGYNLYITRADSWLETQASPIFNDEWNRVVASDKELELSTEDYYDRKVNGGIERIHPVIWIPHADRVPFWFVDGAITTKNPDMTTIKKMVALARKLNAKVLGEEGEEYGADGEPMSSK